MRCFLLLSAVSAQSSWLPYPVTQPCATLPLSETPVCNSSLSLDERVNSLIEQLLSSEITQGERANLLSNKALPVSSLGLGFYDWWNEALHGVAGAEGLSVIGLGACFKTQAGVKRCATSFPAAITTSSSFNRTLFGLVGEAIGLEGRVFNNVHRAGLTYWTPNINIFRDPRWGRGQETPGEDPVLNSDYAEYFVRGFQTGPEDPSRLKASACCKHFVAYSLENSDSSTRHNFNAVVSEQDLGDTYMPAFLSCVARGKASGVMCSYNAVNGVPMCANGPLLSGLRAQGFEGYITGDCGAVKDCTVGHQYSPLNKTCATVLAAGLDSDCGQFFEWHLADEMNSGSVTTELWSAAARHLFKVQMRLGMFDADTVQPFRKLGEDLVDSTEHRQLALDAALQGVVLVKNINHTLPLSSNSSLAVIGPNGNATVQMQSNYHGEAPLLISPFEGLSHYFNRSQFLMGCSISGPDVGGIAAAQKLAQQVDRVVLVLGLDQTMERETVDRSSIVLPGVQSELLSVVAAAALHPITLVIISGGPVDLSAAKANPKVGAILIAGYPGQAGGQAISDTLVGKNNPSGRLTQTWYPANFTSQCKMSDMNLRPNSTTGCPGRTYRFYTGVPVFKFGDGLSYSNFSYQLKAPALMMVSSVEEVKMSLEVTNVGEHSGAHVILAMVQAPQGGQNGNPLQSLRQYERVELEPGRTALVHLVFTPEDFMLTDPQGHATSMNGDWIVKIESVTSSISVVVRKS